MKFSNAICNRLKHDDGRDLDAASVFAINVPQQPFPCLVFASAFAAQNYHFSPSLKVT